MLWSTSLLLSWTGRKQYTAHQFNITVIAKATKQSEVQPLDVSTGSVRNTHQSVHATLELSLKARRSSLRSWWIATHFPNIMTTTVVRIMSPKRPELLHGHGTEVSEMIECNCVEIEVEVWKWLRPYSQPRHAIFNGSRSQNVNLEVEADDKIRISSNELKLIAILSPPERWLSEIQAFSPTIRRNRKSEFQRLVSQQAK